VSKDAVAEASRNGKHNGQIATPQGPQTVPNKNQTSLDAARVGSKFGVKKTK
jgi:hypothetical protein